MLNYIEKGQNHKGLWVVEVVNEKTGWRVETREFARKAGMTAWLKQEKSKGDK